MGVKFTLFPNYSFRADSELYPWASPISEWSAEPQTQWGAPHFFQKELPASPLPLSRVCCTESLKCANLIRSPALSFQPFLPPATFSVSRSQS